MTLLTTPSLGALVGDAHRVLLLNTPAIDVRLPWAQWRQPTGLLSIGTSMLKSGHDVRLIDCLQQPLKGKLERTRMQRVTIDGKGINVWRFGMPPSRAAARVREWQQEGWHPDRVLISCGLSTWWQATTDLVNELRPVTDCPITLGGPYATFYPEHAAAHSGADSIVSGDVLGVDCLVPDIGLYRPAPIPRFAGIHLCHPAILPNALAQYRCPDDLLEEITEKAALGVTTFAFFDDWLGPSDREQLVAVLECVARHRLPNVGFVALGNFSPLLIDKSLAALLRLARFRQIILHDDVQYLASGETRRLCGEPDYVGCVGALHQAGFRPRTDEVVAAVLVGVPGENLESLTEHLIRLASIVGSVNLVPYQWTPGQPESAAYGQMLVEQDGALDPATLNAQLFPMARTSGARIGDYWELTRLSALLNSKRRSRTFDFLGDTFTAQLVRTSVGKRLWNPFRHRSTSLPIVTAGTEETG